MRMTLGDACQQPLMDARCCDGLPIALHAQRLSLQKVVTDNFTSEWTPQRFLHSLC